MQALKSFVLQWEDGRVVVCQTDGSGLVTSVTVDGQDVSAEFGELLDKTETEVGILAGLLRDFEFVVRLSDDEAYHCHRDADGRVLGAGEVRDARVLGEGDTIDWDANRRKGDLAGSMIGQTEQEIRERLELPALPAGHAEVAMTLEDAIDKVVGQYVNDDEESHYIGMVANGENAENHIVHALRRLQKEHETMTAMKSLRPFIKA